MTQSFKYSKVNVSMETPITFKKTFETGPGVYIVDHTPTGVRYVGYSIDPLKDAKNILSKISTGKSKYKTLNVRYKNDPQFDLWVHHTKSVTVAKKIAIDYTSNLNDSINLIVNVGDYVKVRRKSSAKK